MVANEGSKYRKFLEGLRTNIKRYLTILKLNNYVDLLGRAILTELDLIQSQATRSVNKITSQENMMVMVTKVNIRTLVASLFKRIYLSATVVASTIMTYVIYIQELVLAVDRLGIRL